MGEWYNTFDGIFFISLSTIIFGSVSVCIKYCYKSRCKKCEVCCVKIERDGALENEEDLNNFNYIIRTGTEQKNNDIV